ncbi:CHAT domain-containing protein [Nocardia abscessus]|uniref:CHAT domain-containing protein n=1 Tax=Nocardia abscessus TaxID=120957 RepID=UPI0024538F99|nr:CHAT domain-containing protein [Nocardia abscessus]
MSANQYRSQLTSKRKQRIDAEKKAGEFRTKESKKRAEAAAARLAASKSKSESTVKSKLREAERKDKEAETAGKEAGRWQLRASGYAKSEAELQGKLAKAEKSEADAAEVKRKREEQRAQRLAAGQRAELESRVATAESAVEHVLRQLPAPKPEKLRVLILGAAGEGDLRVGREQKRIRAAVESALHRNQIEFDVRPAATPADLLEGITKFRPHVVHFSGHSDDDFLVFEQDTDDPNSGMDVAAGAFARAIQATDNPPLLVLLNSCNSAAQIDNLAAEVVPFAIGMADEIDDGDAINYAAQFYASITNGQSINSSHLSGRSALELAGLSGADLPTLACAPDVDPSVTILVKAME